MLSAGQSEIFSLHISAWEPVRLHVPVTGELPSQSHLRPGIQAKLHDWIIAGRPAASIYRQTTAGCRTRRIDSA